MSKVKRLKKEQLIKSEGSDKKPKMDDQIMD